MPEARDSSHDAVEGERPARIYVGDGIEVRWEPTICIHSGVCARALPAVFAPRRRPWVMVENATADEIAAVIDRCPSGALSYMRTAAPPAPRAD